MNILYITSGFNVGGVERCIMSLINELKSTNNIWVASKGGTAISWLEDEKIQHLEIGDTEKKNPFEIIKNVYLITKYIREHDIDIVHSHHRMTTMYCKIINKFKKIKYVHTQHLCIEDKLAITGKILSNTNIICVSNAAKEILLNKCNVKPKSILTIYNTVNTNKTEHSVSEKVINLRNKGYYIIAQINRLVDYKGVFDFIKAAEIVCKRNNKIKFIMLGDGPEREKLEDYISSNNLQDSIFLLGSKNNIIDYYKYIDLVVISSYIEGLPLVPLEAFSQSIPVIGTNIPGTDEEIIDELNGFLVETNRPDIIAEKIIYLYNNKKVYKSMSIEAKNIFESRFSKEQYIESHKKYYKELK